MEIRARAKRCLDAGDDGSAARILARAHERFPDHSGIALDLFDALVLGQDYQTAVSLLDQVWRDVSHLPGSHLRMAKALQKQGADQRALNVLEGGCRQFPDQGALRVALAGVLADQGNHREAVVHFSAACERESKPQWFNMWSNSLAALDQDDDVIAVLNKGLGQAPDSEHLLISLANHHESKGDMPAAIAALSHLSACRPDLFSVHVRLSGLAQESGRLDLAVQSLTRAHELRPEAKALFARLMRLMIEADCLDEAVAMAMQACVAGRLPRALALELASCLIAGQRMIDAQILIEAEVSARRSRLPENLAQAVATLEADEAPSAIAEARIVWSREIAGVPQSEHDAWRDAAMWGQKASQLVADWVEAGANARDVMDLLSQPPGLDPIHEQLEAGNGVLLVASHVGPFNAPFQYLMGAELPLSVVQKKPVLGPSLGYEPITPHSGVVAMTREIVGRLGKGEVVCLLADGQLGRNFVAVELGSREVRLSTFVPRLLFRHRHPTYWIGGRWQGHIVEIDLIESVVPGPDESEDAWLVRWAEWYLDLARKAVTANAANAGLSGGFWRSLGQEEPDEIDAPS